MNNFHNEIDSKLNKVYDSLPKAMDKFYSYSENEVPLEALHRALSRGYPVFEEMEHLQDLYDNLDGFIKFETNQCYDINDF